MSAHGGLLPPGYNPGLIAAFLPSGYVISAHICKELGLDLGLLGRLNEAGR